MCDLDNSQCRGEIRNISIRLQQHVDLRASDGLVYTNTHLLEQKNYDGLGANQATGGLNRYLELNLSNIKQMPKSFDDNKPLSKDDLYLAERIQPTASGSIVKLHYTLTVFANYGSVCAEEPHCTIPLTITPPPLPGFGQIQAPPGWAPVVFSTFNFSLPGPGQVMAAASYAVAPVTPGISINFGAHEEVKMHGPGISLSIDTDKINREVPIPRPSPAPGHIEMNVPMPHMNMNIPMPNMEMNMEMHGSTTYHEEKTVNGVKVSSTTSSSYGGIPPPAPHHGPHTGGGATINMGMGMPMPGMSTHADDGNAHAQVSFGGMNVSAHAKIDSDDDQF